MRTIAMTVYNRPEYTATVLESLARCVGIEDYLLVVQADPGDPSVIEIVESWSASELSLELNPQQLRCNINTGFCINRAFQFGPYVIYIDDDCVPSPDMLLLFEHCRRYRSDPDIATIGAYSKTPVFDDPTVLYRREGFNPWGWATWADRWERFYQQWAPHGPVAWDTHLLHTGLVPMQIRPDISRVQNIGKYGGTHMMPHQYEQFVADQVATDIPDRYRLRKSPV